MSRRTDLPIMLGKNLKKGILLFQDKKMGGMNMLVVWLNRTVESGSNFDMSDIDKVNVVIHFCDKDTLKLTIDTLTRAWKNWKGGDSDDVLLSDMQNMETGCQYARSDMQNVSRTDD